MITVPMAAGYFVRVHVLPNKDAFFAYVEAKEGVLRINHTRGLFFGKVQFKRYVGDIYICASDGVVPVAVHELYHAVIHTLKYKKNEIGWEDINGKAGPREEVIAHMLEDATKSLLSKLA